MSTTTARPARQRLLVITAIALTAGACSSPVPDVPDKALSVEGEVAAPSGLELISEVQDKAADLLGDKAGDGLHCHVKVPKETINQDPLPIMIGAEQYVVFLCAPVSGTKADHPYVRFEVPAAKGSLDVDQMAQGGQNQAIDTTGTSNLLPWPPLPATT